MIINRTRSTGTFRLLSNIALMGAALAIPATAITIPAMATPALKPGVVRTNFPQCDGTDPWCNRDNQWNSSGKESDSKDEECDPPAWNLGGKQSDKQSGNHGWNYMSPNGWFRK
ncbi:hypothetical protein [Nocardia sp. NPDC051463]|uniref:hypothetical protein n=1 Tax=Nocardia sp. NPDC051463 TaxID=3154845 RepID=UPI00344B3272